MYEQQAPHRSTPFDPRTVFLPPAPSTDTGPPRRLPHPRELVGAVRTYYRDRLSWLALGVSSVVLCYGGGAAMFWYHSAYLGEGGPAISWQVHWLLDSTVGFVALTPALFLLLPLMTWLTTVTVARAHPTSAPLVFAALMGGAFAALTTPGPIAHDLLVGRGTWLADQVTRVLGDPSAPVVPHHEYGMFAHLTQQFGFGLPLYIVTAYLAVLTVHAIAAPRQPSVRV